MTVERVVAVHDVGRIVNPLAASSQAEGGVIQGIGYALSEELVVDPTTGMPVNGHLDDYKVPTIADVPEIVVDFVERRRREPAEPRREGPRRAADRADRRGDRERLRARDRTPRRRAAADARPRARGARVSAYARPASLDEALELLAADGAAPLGGGTDLAGQVDRGIRAPTTLVDLRDAGLATVEPDGDGVRIGAAVTLAELAASPLLEPYAAVVDSGLARRVAAAPQRRHRGRQPLPAHALLVLPGRGVALLARRRRHVLRADRRPPQARPRAGRLHLGAPVRPRAGARGLRGDGRGSLVGWRPGACRCSTSTGRPTAENRSLLTLEPGELVVAVRLPAPPDASAYRRLGERAAFSFPLVSVAAARRGDEVALVAAGVANVPRALDRSDPLAGLPGNPQSAWKRRALATLAERALAAVSPGS